MSMRIPAHQVQESPSSNSRSITIADWTITTSSTHIASQQWFSEAEKTLGIPLPEMTFASNFLALKHTPSQLEVRFDALPALKEVPEGEGWEQRYGGGVLVQHAKEWGKTRTTESSILTPDSKISTTPVKPYDWTYSTLHAGSLVSVPPAVASLPQLSSSSSSSSPPPCSAAAPPQPSSWRPARPGHEDETIDLELLSRQDPILFYDDLPLFESELDDNGSSMLSVRVRVMPHSIFVLQRHFLRVDGVLFRLRDTRLFHRFGSSLLVKETSGWEADYDDLRSRLPPGGKDLTALTPQWVYQQVSAKRRPPKGVVVPEGMGKPWPGLGSSLEVLELETGRTGEEGLVSGVERLRM